MTVSAGSQRFPYLRDSGVLDDKEFRAAKKKPLD